MNYELRRIWEEEVVSNLSYYLTTCKELNKTRKKYSRYLVSLTRIETGPFRM
jgi:hypothetical protein